MTEIKKFCNKCGKKKLLKEFCRNKSKRDGYQSNCKGCNKADRKSVKIKQYQRQYQRQYRDQYHQQYRKTGKSKKYQKQYQERYGKTEKGKQVKKKGDALRRTRKTQAGGRYTITEWYKLCKFYGFHCLRCNEQFLFEKLTMDHIKPISKGGASFIWNAQPLCKSCNSKKKDKEIDYRQTLPDWIKRDEPVWQQGKLF